VGTMQQASASRNHEIIVLVVEDEPSISDLVRQILQGNGYLVVHRSGGEAGLSAATSLQPEIIILDLILPDIAGSGVLRALKSNPRTRKIPVIVCSAVANWLPEGERHVAFAILPKPFDIAELLRLVELAAERRSPAASIGVRLRQFLNRPSLRANVTRHNRGIGRRIIGLPHWRLKAV
jgi:two-component system, chemotaxis family, response regulator PixH